MFKINDWFSILPEVYFRSVINAEEDNLFYANFVGGPMRGRYIGSQMPFVGFNQATPAKNLALVMNLDFRACLNSTLRLRLRRLLRRPFRCYDGKRVKETIPRA